MKQKLLYILAAIFLLGTGFVLGQNYQTDTTQTVVQTKVETITSSAPDFISIEKCSEQDILFCFGSGRTIFAETEKAAIFSLVSKEGVLRYGLMDKDTSELFELTIE